MYCHEASMQTRVNDAIKTITSFLNLSFVFIVSITKKKINIYSAVFVNSALKLMRGYELNAKDIIKTEKYIAIAFDNVVRGR